MWDWRRLRTPKLSVVVILHNMQRESERTLYSLTTAYQKGISASQYEVIVVESSSTKPIKEEDVYSYGPQFKYLKVDWEHPSPCKAMNQGVSEAKNDIVMCLIDGARILSPSIIAKTLKCFRKFNNPFVYTLGMHLGPKVQQESILDGYCQSVEDNMLKKIEWEKNGYSLFSVSSLALSSRDGYFSNLSESNCFAMYKKKYTQMCGYDEKFISPGGGLCNLDIYNRVMEQKGMTPVILIGEATFHQYHGGVSTNVPMEKHPWQIFADEYRNIRKKDYATVYKKPCYFGEVPEEACLPTVDI